MRNLTFKAAMLNDSRTTVNRQSTDGQSQRHYKQTPLSKRWKVLMTMVFLFTLAIGNVWAAEGDPVSFVPSAFATYSTARAIVSTNDANLGTIYYGAHSTPSTVTLADSKKSYRLRSSSIVINIPARSKIDVIYAGTTARNVFVGLYEVTDASAYLVWQRAAGYSGHVAAWLNANANTEKAADGVTTMYDYFREKGVATSSGKISSNSSVYNDFLLQNDGSKITLGTNSSKFYTKVWEADAAISIPNGSVPKKIEVNAGSSIPAGKYLLCVGDNGSNVGITEIIVSPVYQLTWALDGGSITSAADAYTNAGYYAKGTELTAPTVTKAGADFAGWSPALAATMSAAATTYTATWATACSAGVPGNVTKGALTAGEITLTAEGSAASGDTWYWQTSESGVDKTNAGSSFVATAAGTYYVRSYNTAADCWNVTAKSIELTAEDFLAHYAITYNKGEYGTGTIAGGEKVEGVAYTLSSDRFTRAGYVQTGWSLTDGGAKAYDLGGSYTSDATQEFFPVWAETSTYVASFACGATAPAGWTFSNAGTYGDTDATADYVCKFVTAGTSTPKQDPAEGKDGTTDNDVAFAKNTNAIATYDLGAATTVTALNVTLCGGSGSAFNETIEYLGADGSTVKKTYINSLSAGNWNDNLISKNEIVEDVRYIRVHGASKWVAMKAFSVTYVDLVTKYNVTFDKNDEGASGSQTTLKYAEGAEVTLPACTFIAPTNMEFDAWTSTDVTISNNKFTMPNKPVTIKATWKALVAKYTVIFKDGDETLGTKQFDVASNPSDADIEKTKPLYTFAAWQKDAADIALDAEFWATVAKDAEVTLTARYEGKYASSINVEQWVLDNGAGKGATTKTSALLTEMETKNYLSNIAWENKNNELDTLDDSKTDGKRNYAYLGLKVKKDASNVRLLLQDGKSLKVKFGNVAATPNIKIGDADATAMTITDGVYSLDAASGDREITISTTSAGAVVIKQIMINEDIAAVTLPWRVTYDANGGTCATAEAIWSGADLILPDVTPAVPADYTFAGWYDEVSGGSLQGVAGASYSATDNITLHAQFAPVEYAIAYDGNGATSGSMTAGAAGWGTLVTPDANAFVKSGNVFSGWVITKTSDGSATGITFSEGKFEMPKYDVTLVAQWDDVSKVAVIVETNVKYESLADAISAAEAGQTIQLLQNIEQAAGVTIDKNLTLDLNGKIYTCTSGSNVNYRAIKITAGNVTIQNGSIIAVPTANFEGGCYGPIRIEGATANVTLEDLTLQNGRHYGLGIKLVEGYLRMEDCTVISENGGGGLEVAGTADVINCTFTQTGLDNAHAWISTCLATCDNGVLNVQGGTYTSEHYSMYVYTSGGEMDVESGSFTGDMVNQVTLSSYPDAVGTINISGGTFEGVGEEPIHFTTDNTGKTTIAISGGTFDAPVANEYCAYGYVPAPEVAPGVYTVMPKDGVEIIGVVTTGGTNKTVSGLYKGDAAVNLDNTKKIGDGKYIYVTLKEGYTFEENDVLIVDVNGKADIGTKALEITTGVGNIDGDVWKSIAFDDYATGENIISLEGIAAGQTSIGLKRSANQNAKINGLRVLRPMKPMLTAIAIDTRDGVIDEANKTVAVQIPYEADLAALTVVPTIVWNEAAASNSIVVNDGSAWIEGANTYKLTDKDGDYTVYTITLTRDVQKHTVSFNTHGGTAVASEEVVHGEYLAAAPAAPEKEENVFKHWAETEDGEAVEVTTVQINADKTFHAVWEAEPAGIKLFNGNVLNTTNFISAAATTIEISEVEYPCLVAFASNRSSLAGAKQGDLVMYSATTDAAKIKFDLYNANGSAKTAYVWLVEEGDDAATQLDAIEIAGETRVKTAYYEFNGTKNRTVYLTSGSKADIKVLQAKVIESGAAIKQFGQAGYSLNLNKGRLATVADVAVPFEGATLTVSSEYSVLNSSNLATKSANSFNVTSPVIMHVERSGGKYYVYQDPENKGTLYSANADIELNATGTWYLSSETATSAASFTLIRFDLPKCAKPVVADLSNVDYCSGETIDALTVSATVSDGGTLLYQWYKDGEAIEGAEAATYQPAADGEYYVVVVNTLAGHQNSDATQSNTIAVTGHAGTVISGTTGAEDWVGEEVTISVTASGKNLSYVWYTCDDELGTNPVAIEPAVNAAELNVTVADADSYYKVIVSGDCGEAQEAVITVVVRQLVDLVDVTGNMTWDFSKANDGSAESSNLCNDAILANVDGIVNNDDFKSDNIKATANKFASGKLQASMIKFHTTVDGMIKVVFSNTGSKSSDRYLTVNGRKTDKGSRNTTAVTYTGFVYAGDVELGVVEGDGNMLNFTSVEFKATVDYPRTVNPSFLGTLCWTNNAVLGGATLYEFAGKNENNYLVFDEVEENRLEAGKPYIFMPENGNTEIKVYNTDNEDALTEDQAPVNHMYGTITGKTLVPGVDDNMYYFSASHIWAVKDFVVNIPVPAYYCYVDYAAVLAAEPAPAPAPGRRRVTMGVNGEAPAVTTGMENLNAGEQPVKMIINGQIFILRGEKLFDVTGKLVK